MQELALVLGSSKGGGQVKDAQGEFAPHTRSQVVQGFYQAAIDWRKAQRGKFVAHSERYIRENFSLRAELADRNYRAFQHFYRARLAVHGAEKAFAGWCFLPAIDGRCYQRSVLLQHNVDGCCRQCT